MPYRMEKKLLFIFENHSENNISPVIPKTKKSRFVPGCVKWIAIIFALAITTKFILHLLFPRDVKASGEMVTLKLAGGPFNVPYYCAVEQPKGILILGTGDGGWSYWEENVAKHLMKEGFAIGGWDCRKFADSRTYDHAQLCAGFEAAVAAVRERCDPEAQLPVWYGGWSTGADQSVAAAISVNRPPNLVGLLLAAPGTRGRYGITSSDMLGITPEGPDTFSLAELAPKLGGIDVIQFIAGLDPMDDQEFLASYTGPKLMLKLPGLMHDMGGAGPEFLKKVDQAIEWSLRTKQ